MRFVVLYKVYGMSGRAKRSRDPLRSIERPSVKEVGASRRFASKRPCKRW